MRVVHYFQRPFAGLICILLLTLAGASRATGAAEGSPDSGLDASPGVSITTIMQSDNPWTILGLEKGAPPSEIKRAYRQLSKQYHPDLNPTNRKANEEAFKRISIAYDLVQKNISSMREGALPDPPAGSAGAGPGQRAPVADAAFKNRYHGGDPAWDQLWSTLKNPNLTVRAEARKQAFERLAKTPADFLAIMPVQPWEIGYPEDLQSLGTASKAAYQNLGRFLSLGPNSKQYRGYIHALQANEQFHFLEAALGKAQPDLFLLMVDGSYNSMIRADSPRFNRLILNHLASFFRGHPSPDQIAELGRFVPSSPMITAIIDASLHSSPNPQTLLKLIETAPAKEQAPLLAKYWPNFLKLQPADDPLRDYLLAVASKSPVQLDAFVRSALKEPLRASRYTGIIQAVLTRPTNAQAAKLLDPLIDRFARAHPTLAERDQLKTILSNLGQNERARGLDSKIANTESRVSPFAKCVSVKTALFTRLR